VTKSEKKACDTVQGGTRESTGLSNLVFVYMKIQKEHVIFYVNRNEQDHNCSRTIHRRISTIVFNKRSSNQP